MFFFLSNQLFGIRGLLSGLESVVWNPQLFFVPSFARLPLPTRFSYAWLVWSDVVLQRLRHIGATIGVTRGGLGSMTLQEDVAP